MLEETDFRAGVVSTAGFHNMHSAEVATLQLVVHLTNLGIVAPKMQKLTEL